MQGLIKIANASKAVKIKPPKPPKTKLPKKSFDPPKKINPPKSNKSSDSSGREEAIKEIGKTQRSAKPQQNVIPQGSYGS